MQREERRIAAVGFVTLLLLSGCGGEQTPDAGGTSPTPSAAVTASPGASLPADGVTLKTLGYQNGPIREFSLPISSRLIASVDQDNNVTAVLAAPAPAEVAAYLRRALPPAGFTITATSDDTAMQFAGHGWTGSFTADGATSAILLRPT